MGTEHSKTDGCSHCPGNDNDKSRTVAFVKCAGLCDKRELEHDCLKLEDLYIFSGIRGTVNDSCGYGCIGDGACVSVCPSGAMQLVNGIARVDEKKCSSCGRCTEVCPRNLICMVPEDASVRVQCSNQESGEKVANICPGGCISCCGCVNLCPGAIQLHDNAARIDYSVCVRCGHCAQICPRHIIRLFGPLVELKKHH